MTAQPAVGPDGPNTQPLALDPSLLLVTLTMVIGLVAWRRGEYFTGGADSVVLAKAALAVLAFVGAALLVRNTHITRAVGGRTAMLVVAYLAASMLGAWAAGTLVASAVLAVRVAIIMLTISLLLRRYDGTQVMLAITTAMGVVALYAAATGFSSFVDTGKLEGGTPPLARNDLALLAALPALTLTWRAVHGLGSGLNAVMVAVFASIVWLTGSRTSMLLLVIATLLMLWQVRVRPVPVVMIVLAALPVVAYVALGTSVVSQFFTRGDVSTVTTLSNRTIAWSSALSRPESFWQLWFGDGLSVKRIAVDARWWNEQILDSSWISAFVQAGVVGAVVLATLVICSAIAIVGMLPPWRSLYTAVFVFLIGRSVLESGLLDGSGQFAVFFLLCTASERHTRVVAPLMDHGQAHRPMRRDKPEAAQHPAIEPEPEQAPEPGVAFAVDDFARTMSKGWGTAIVGGRWTFRGGTATDYSVSVGAGLIAGAVSANRAIYLNGAAALEQDIMVDFTLDRSANNGGAYVSLIGRRVSAGNDYRAKVRYLNTGEVQLYLIRSVSRSEETLAWANVPDLIARPNTTLRVRLQLAGSHTTTARAKVWLAARPEPAGWTVSETSATPPSLQEPGHVGVLHYLAGSWSGPPANLSVGNLSAVDWSAASVPTAAAGSSQTS